ncbi:MAG: hypothetical protein ACKOCC_06550 [Actinomycetota bacterium]
MESVWETVPGQARAIDQLARSATRPVHAYLLLGPDGCGTDEAARALASVLLCGTDEPHERAASLVLRGAHPDVHEIRREGASILAEQVDNVIQIASTTGVEGTTKVIIIHEAHLLESANAARLLKTIEEPPSGVHFVLVAEQAIDTLVTIASRCVTIQFAALDDTTVADVLVSRGVEPAAATAAAASAGGSLVRASLLASDPHLATRRAVFANIPRRIDGTGATVMAIVEQVLGLLDDAAEPLARRHEQEVADREEALAVMGVKRSGKKALEDRHKREIRRHRTDELRAGLSVVAGVYRDELARSTDLLRPDSYAGAIERIHEAMRRLALNVNEAILLRDLVWSLPSPSSDAALQFVLEEQNA